MELDNEAYTNHCIARCAQFPQRFSRYMEAPNMCAQALMLRLLRDMPDDPRSSQRIRLQSQLYGLGHDAYHRQIVHQTVSVLPSGAGFEP